jgi:hypothetical protein
MEIETTQKENRQQLEHILLRVYDTVAESPKL